MWSGVIQCHETKSHDTNANTENWFRIVKRWHASYQAPGQWVQGDLLKHCKTAYKEDIINTNFIFHRHKPSLIKERQKQKNQTRIYRRSGRRAMDEEISNTYHKYPKKSYLAYFS